MLAGCGASSSNQFNKSVKLEMFVSKMSVLDKFKSLKEAGFDAVEVNSSSYSLRELIKASKISGLKISAVNYSESWSSPVTEGKALAKLEAAIEEASKLGASVVNLNPGVKHSRITKTACFNQSNKTISELLPLLVSKNIKLALENVWNGFLQTPRDMADFIASINSRFVGACLDTGNASRFGRPESWWKVLQEKIFSVQVQSFDKNTALKNQSIRSGLQPASVQFVPDGYEGFVCIDGYGGDIKQLQNAALSIS